MILNDTRMSSLRTGPWIFADTSFCLTFPRLFPMPAVRLCLVGHFRAAARVSPSCFRRYALLPAHSRAFGPSRVSSVRGQGASHHHQAGVDCGLRRIPRSHHFTSSPLLFLGRPASLAIRSSARASPASMAASARSGSGSGLRPSQEVRLEGSRGMGLGGTTAAAGIGCVDSIPSNCHGRCGTVGLPRFGPLCACGYRSFVPGTGRRQTRVQKASQRLTVSTTGFCMLLILGIMYFTVSVKAWGSRSTRQRRCEFS
jgi:hypothetical protein